MFRLDRDASVWFAKLERGPTGQRFLATQFHGYYLSLLVGLATGKRTPLAEVDGKDIIERFVGDVAQSRAQVLGLLLHAELRRHRIALSSKREVHGKIVELFDAEQRNPGLTSAGFRVMNEYAQGGFEEFRRHFGDRAPEDALVFLDRYHRFLGEALANSAAFGDAGG